jgi:hypothetical protein
MKVTVIGMRRTSSYGHYRIIGLVNGIEVTCITTDSEAFDYLNDHDYPEKHKEAIAHCERKLIETFNNL